MPDNIIIASGPSGATYNMATDYGFGTSADAHVQIIKTVFGDDTTSTRVSNTNPMPVQLFSGFSGGSTASIIEDGELKVKGTFNIGNSMAVYGSTAAYLKVIVAGGVTGTSGGSGDIGSVGNAAVYSAVEVTGAVQGISGGQALVVSGTDFDIRGLTAASDSVSVYGVSGGMAVGVSATDLDIRNLTATDVVTVVGTTASNVGVTGTVTAIATNLDIRNLAAGTDNVAVRSANGGATLPVDLYAAGTALGVSGDALKVAFDSVTGVTFSVNVASDIGVSNTSGTTLSVEGSTGMMPIVVKGFLGDQSVFVSATDLDIRNLSASDEITVVGAVATNTADISTKIVGVDSKLATLNTAVSTTNTKVDASNRSLASLSDSVTTVGTESFVKTSVNQVVPPTKLFVQSMTISGTGKPLRKQTLQNGITVKASPDNVSTVFIGGTSIQNNIAEGYPLLAGEEIFLSISNASFVFMRTNSGRSATVNVIGS